MKAVSWQKIMSLCVTMVEFVRMAPEKVTHMDVSPRQGCVCGSKFDSILGTWRCQPCLDGFKHTAPSGTHFTFWQTTGWYGYGNVTLPVTQVCVTAKRGGVIMDVDASRAVVKVNEDEMQAGEAGIDIYNLIKYTRSNQNTCINQRIIVNQGDFIAWGYLGRWSINRFGWVGIGSKHACGVHALERLQLRRLDSVIWACG